MKVYYLINLITYNSVYTILFFNVTLKEDLNNIREFLTWVKGDFGNRIIRESSLNSLVLNRCLTDAEVDDIYQQAGIWSVNELLILVNVSKEIDIKKNERLMLSKCSSAE